jgi:hypothetical protein
VLGEGVVDGGAEAGVGFLCVFFAGGEKGVREGEGEDLEELGLGVGREEEVWDAGGVEEVGARGGDDEEGCKIGDLGCVS